DGRGADVRHGQRGKRLDEVDERVPAEGEGRQELELRLRDTRLGVRERGEGRAAETDHVLVRLLVRRNDAVPVGVDPARDEPVDLVPARVLDVVDDAEL